MHKKGGNFMQSTFLDQQRDRRYIAAVSLYNQCSFIDELEYDFAIAISL